MKKYDGFLKAVQDIIKGIEPNLDITETLLQHKCFYLISKINNHKNKVLIENIEKINKISVNERYINCKLIFDCLIKENILFAVVKGAVLSMVAYESPFDRYSHDIDLLVSRKDIDKVKKILTDNGFVQGRATKNGIIAFSRKKILFETIMSHQIAPFIKSTKNDICRYVDIDVNIDIIWGESEKKIDMDFVLQQTMSFNICGVNIKKLKPEMEFIALCMHHYKDINSIYLLFKGNFKLKLFCDIYFYLKNNKLDFKILQNICMYLNVTEFVHYCIYYTNMIFNDKELTWYCTKINSQDFIKIVNRFGLADDEFHEWNINFFDRLFNANMEEYLKNVLTESQLNKIEINKLMIEQI